MEGQNVNSTISKISITYTKFCNCNAIKLKVTRRQILYIFAYMWNLKNKTSQQIYKNRKDEEIQKTKQWFATQEKGEEGMKQVKGNLPDPGIKPRSPAFQADSLTSEPPGKPYIVIRYLYKSYIYSHKKYKRRKRIYKKKLLKWQQEYIYQ